MDCSYGLTITAAYLYPDKGDKGNNHQLSPLR